VVIRDNNWVFEATIFVIANRKVQPFGYSI
jgi:hypothetical protein